MADPKVVVRVVLDTSKVLKGLQSIEKSFKKSVTEINQRLEILQKAWRALEKTVDFVVNKLVTALKLAGTQSIETQKQLNQVTHLWDKLKNTFGESVSKSSALKLGLDATKSALKGFIDLFSTDATARTINGFFAAIARGLGLTIHAFLGAKRMMNEAGDVAAREGQEHSRHQAPTRKFIADAAQWLGFGPQLLPGVKAEFPLTKVIQETSKFDQVLDDLASSLLAAAKNGTELLKVTKPGKAVREQPYGYRTSPLSLLGGAGLASGLLGITGNEGLDKSPFNLNAGNLDLKGPDIPALQKNFQKMIEEYSKGFEGLMEAFDKFNKGQASAWDVAIELSKTKGGQMLLANQAWQQAATLMFDQLIAGFSAIVSGITEIIASGTDDIAGAIGGLFGGVMKTIGQAMIQLGTIMGVLAIFTGGATAGPAAALLGGGIALVAIGSLLGKGSSGSSSSGGGGRVSGGAHLANPYAPLDKSGSVGPASIPGIPSGFTSRRGGEQITNYYELNFGKTFVAGSPAAVGREIEKMLNAAKRLG